ncbi:MAG: sigma-70 family RNA polymerase sigma factor [Bryobacteraceae bacterium]
MKAESAASMPAACRRQEEFGFVPNVFRSQWMAPHLVEAQVGLLEAVLFEPSVLSRQTKDSIVLAVAAAHGDTYWPPLLVERLRLSGMAEGKAAALASDFRAAGLDPTERRLIEYGVRLALLGEACAGRLPLEEAMDAALTAAMANFLVTLSQELRPQPDFDIDLPPAVPPSELFEEACAAGDGQPWPVGPETAPGAEFAGIARHFGYLPDLDRTLAGRPAVARALGSAIEAVVDRDGRLSRMEKEAILLRMAIRQGNEYCIALQAGVLRRQFGYPPDFIDQMVAAGVDDWHPKEWCPEAVAVMALARFRHTWQRASGAVVEQLARNGAAEECEDPDGPLVRAAQEGDRGAFEQLVQLHGRRVYRLLMGLLGDPEEARDSMQDTFLKAYRALPGFEARARFGSWLLTVATNTGIERLRARRPMESLDELSSGSEEPFRPRQLRAWDDTPEQRFAKEEVRGLIEKEVRLLPAKYRTVIMLRDIEQVSNEHAAAALGLSLPAVKARLLRARMMLREALSIHFSRPGVEARR